MLRKLRALPLGASLRPLALPKPCLSHRPRCPIKCSSAAFEGSLPSDSSSGKGDPVPMEQDYKPFPRINEKDPFRLLGIDSEASFEEIRDAKNFLYEHYKWHEPSREAIELAIDAILQEKIQLRNKLGYQPPGGRPRRVEDEEDENSLGGKFQAFLTPDVTLRTIINEGCIYALMATWALYSVDQSIPLAGAAVYSAFMYRAKRVRRTPDGPFLFKNPLAGALLSTVFNFGVAMGISNIAGPFLATTFETSVRQVSSFMAIVIVGVLGIYLR